MSLKKRGFNQRVVSVITCGVETMTLTKQSVTKLRVAQRRVERLMPGTTLRDQKRNEKSV